MSEIKDEAKQELGQYFEEGIHKVRISGMSLETDGSERLEIGLIGENGETATVRKYLTEKAMIYTINTMRAIVVHNEADKAKKDAVRDEVTACKTTEELIVLLQKKLDCGECWYSKYKNGKTYETVDADNNPITRDSYDTNIFAFEPKPPKTSPTVQKQAAMDAIGGGEITKENLNEFPFK